MSNVGESLKAKRFSLGFLLSEWDELVDAWQLRNWEAYRDVKRLGRKTRLSESLRAELWQAFEAVITFLDTEGLITHAAMFTRLADDACKQVFANGLGLDGMQEFRDGEVECAGKMICQQDQRSRLKTLWLGLWPWHRIDCVGSIA